LTDLSNERKTVKGLLHGAALLFGTRYPDEEANSFYARLQIKFPNA
jgi:hypothetical protein